LVYNSVLVDDDSEFLVFVVGDEKGTDFGGVANNPIKPWTQCLFVLECYLLAKWLGERGFLLFLLMEGFDGEGVVLDRGNLQLYFHLSMNGNQA
jgi:hypothetical protein